jgi:hypothetical protein
VAKIGDTPAANRYSGLSVGPDTSISFETQEGFAVDAGKALHRDLAPFRIRILPPDALVAEATVIDAAINLAASTSSQGAFNAIDGALARQVDSIGAGADFSNALGSSNKVFDALSQTSLINTDTTVLRQIVADGVLLSETGSSAFSTIVDSATAADIALQLQYVINAPALTLLVNPTSMSINYTKLQNYGSRGRNGYIFESWGMEQPKISFSGSTGGYYAGVANRSGVNQAASTADGQANSVSGIMWASRRDSAAWQNFMSLYTFYRNNGYIFDTVGGSEAHLFVGSIAIEYDQWTYIGHFESFDFSFEEGSPHKTDFSMDFTVSRMFDTADPPAVVLPLIAPTTSISDPSYSRGVSANRNNGALDLVSRTERQEFANDVEDLAQNPLELFVR